MKPLPTDNQAFIDLKVVATMLRLSSSERQRLASLISAERDFGGVRNDGSIELSRAMKLIDAVRCG